MTNMVYFSSNELELAHGHDRRAGDEIPLASGNVLYKFTESENPTATRVAREVHAIGYKDMNFVGDDAIVESGAMSDDIDKARGDNVDYYLSVNPDNPQLMATLRKIHIPAQGSLEDLPAFALSADNLTEEGLEALFQAENLKEIAAMAHTPEAGPVMMFELIKYIIQEGQGRNETFFFSIVSSTLKSLEGQFGEKAFKHIGKPISFDDERISSDIALVPTLFDVDGFLDNVVDAYIEESDARKKHKLARTLLYYSDGLDEATLSGNVRELRSSIMAAMRPRSA